MSIWFGLLVSFVLLYFGVDYLKIGVRAIKRKEKAIGTIDPKHGIVIGPFLIFWGIYAFIKLVILR